MDIAPGSRPLDHPQGSAMRELRPGIIQADISFSPARLGTIEESGVEDREEARNTTGRRRILIVHDFYRTFEIDVNLSFLDN
jgi:hypothetical protein